MDTFRPSDLQPRPPNRGKSKDWPGILKSVATQWHCDNLFCPYGLTPLAPPLPIAWDGIFSAGIDRSLHKPPNDCKHCSNYRLAGSSRSKWNQKSLSEELQSPLLPGPRWTASDWKCALQITPNWFRQPWLLTAADDCAWPSRWLEITPKCCSMPSDVI